MSDEQAVDEFTRWVSQYGFNDRAFRAIHSATELRYIDIPAWLVVCWRAWTAHRDYAPPSKHGSIYNPKVVGVFEHDVEKDGPGDEAESYIISGLMDVLSAVSWGEKSLGPFKEIIPIWQDCPTDPQRQLVWSFSWKGAGGASRCRMRLKALLPRRLQRYVSKARTANRRPKHHYLVHVLTDLGYAKAEIDELIGSNKMYQMKLDRNVQPAEYRDRTKAEFFLQFDIEPEDLHLLQTIIDPMDFWRAATGRCRPDQVDELIRVRQMEFHFGS